MQKVSLNLGADSKAYLKGYCLEENPTTAQVSYPTVLVVPGGGFQKIPYQEMDRICLAFANAGYQAFYLRYHLLGEIEGALMPTPLLDLAEAIRTLREKEKDWHMNGDLTLMGLSIGGSIVSLYNGCFMREEFLEKANLTKEQAMPNRIVLGYPVTSYDKDFPKTEELQAQMTTTPAQLDSSKLVNKESKPTFLWTTWEDQVLDLTHSLDYVKALKENDVPGEVHIFDHGPHGLGLADTRTTLQGDDHVAHWFSLCLEWMRRN